MERRQLVEVAGHYLVMVALAFLVLSLVRYAVGEVSFWIELGVVAVTVFGYRPVVVALGIGPDVWDL